MAFMWIPNNQKLHLVLFAQVGKLITAKTNSDKIKSLNTWPMAKGGICAVSLSSHYGFN